ncbi:hypothetical protein [Iningainema tapete]|uniref:Uncharacterized protein n=1 Tax=Iningainema tapete BLCC-T55 TaxID=2748662 RepID=A0A8J6XIE0_9CYAN|nr:hypothetical protein [Iningainema tapete]MBD2771276.1 hypothetical protein [Iningainema tapete BLCC-T55]
MKYATNSNRWEITESISVAGSIAGTIAAVFSQQLIYVAAPMSLAFSLNLINRRRLEQKLQEDMSAALINGSVTNQQMLGEMQAVRADVQALSAASKPVNLSGIKSDISLVDKKIEELKTVISDTKPTATKQEIEQIDLVLQQLQSKLSSLTDNFNHRPEPRQIEELKLRTANLQQQLSTVPPAFDPSYLEQQIQLNKSSLSSLSKEFLSRPELEQIKELHSITTNIQSFYANDLEQRFQQLHIQIKEQALQLNQRPNIQQLEELKQVVANIQPFDASHLEQQIQQVQNSISALKQVVANIQPFDASHLEQQIQQVQNSVFALKQVVANIQPFDASHLEQQIQQVQNSVFALNEQFNQRPELEQIQKLQLLTADVQQQLYARPQYIQQLEQEIQQTQAQLQSLKLLDGNRIESLSDSVTLLQQRVLEQEQAIAQSAVPFAQRLRQEKANAKLELKTQLKLMPSSERQLQTEKEKRFSVEALIALARSKGIGSEFEQILQAGKENGFTLHPWPTNLTFSPSRQLVRANNLNRTQSLLILSALPTTDGKVRLWLDKDAIANFYPISQHIVTSLLGANGWREMEPKQISEFIASLNQLFEHIHSKEIVNKTYALTK